jgi:hypothetical protein
MLDIVGAITLTVLSVTATVVLFARIAADRTAATSPLAVNAGHR